MECYPTVSRHLFRLSHQFIHRRHHGRGFQLDHRHSSDELCSDANVSIKVSYSFITHRIHLSGQSRVIYTYRPATGACNITPAVIGDRPNRACIGKRFPHHLHCSLILSVVGVPIGTLLIERIVAAVYCTNDSIVEFITTSPLYMRKTALARVAGTTNQWFITLSWTPTIDQKGPQVSHHSLLPFSFCYDVFMCRYFVLLRSISEV